MSKLAQRTWFVLVSLALGAAAGCRSSTGVVFAGPHLPNREGKPIRVSRPPPPVQVEAIPLRRNKECRYLDGAWTHEGGSWEWQKGRWILSPPGCYYAPPVTRYEEFDVGTALVFRPGVWHPRGGEGENCPEPQECPAPEGK